MGGAYYMPGSKHLDYESPNVILKEGDIVQYHSVGEIVWAGLFAQAEYNTDKWSSFLSASITNESYRYHDKGGNVDGKRFPISIISSRGVLRQDIIISLIETITFLSMEDTSPVLHSLILYSRTITFLPMQMLLTRKLLRSN